jgi:hypothetical protein
MKLNLVQVTFLLLFGSATIAFSNEAFRGMDGHIYLPAKKCDDSQAITKVSALEKWTQRLGEPTGHSQCSCDPNGQCRFDLDPVSPKFVKEAFGKSSDAHGPNCFNASFVANKLVNHMIFTADISMLTHSPLCKEVEQPEPGDIILLNREEDADEAYHAFIYLAPEFSFTKLSGNKSSKYELTELDKNYVGYPIKPECRNVKYRGTRCFVASYVFRCQPWEQYLKSIEIKPSYLGAFSELEKAECETSQIVFGSNGSLSDALDGTLEVLDEMVRSERKNAILNREEKFFLEMMNVRIFSLQEQIKELKSPGYLGLFPPG